MKLLLLLCIACALLAAVNGEANDRPIIGILTQPSSSSLSQFGDNYIAASYVKYVESAGARVVPIHHDAPFSELQSVFNNINGILFPGGGADLDNTTLYQAGEYLYNLTLSANDNGDPFVLFGHCMGFELLTIITSRNFDILDPVDAENITLPLQFTSDSTTSRLFGTAPDDVLNILASENVTMNNHQWSLTPDGYTGNSNLKNFYDILSMNQDREGVPFISTMEAFKYPVYATQWHPEKPQFEWNPDEVIQHTGDAIHAMQYMGDFLVSEARKSTHSYPSEADADAAVIYNWKLMMQTDQPVYTFPYDSSFEQCYFFSKWNSTSSVV